MQHAVNLIEEPPRRRNAPRVYRPNANGFNESDINFVKYYRLNKQLARQLIEDLRPAFPPKRRGVFTLERKVCPKGHTTAFINVQCK